MRRGPLVTVRSRGAFVAVIAAAGLALSGCGTAGTAATVDGQRITESEARLAAEQINASFQLDKPFTTKEAVNGLVIAPALIGFVESIGKNQSADAVRSQLTKVDDPSDATIRLVRANLAYSYIDATTQATVLQRIRDLKVSVNPRYGSFDPAKAGLVDVQPAWIKTVK